MGVKLDGDRKGCPLQSKMAQGQVTQELISESKINT